MYVNVMMDLKNLQIVVLIHVTTQNVHYG